MTRCIFFKVPNSLFDLKLRYLKDNPFIVNKGCRELDKRLLISNLIK